MTEVAIRVLMRRVDPRRINRLWLSLAWMAVCALSSAGETTQPQPAAVPGEVAATEAVPPELPLELDGLPLVLADRFESGLDRWEVTDPAAWGVRHDSDGKTALGILVRVSDYTPPFRSPHNVALIRDLELSDVLLLFRVRSTLDTGPHRDCCVFFGYQDPANFYYVHLGARPDPNSGQIMLVQGGPRRPLTDNRRPVPWSDRWHAVKLRWSAETGHIAIYFDDMDRPLMQVEDKTFGAGRLGLGSFDDMNDFTDVRLYGR
jgi:hypothetical protein